MARPREFDMDDVLTKAAEVFWAQGYEATSIQDLVKQTGLQRGSLYAAFGDKQSLFLAALDHYRHVVVSKLLEHLAGGVSAKAAIQQFFDALVEHLVNGGPLRGCLITNSAVERGLTCPQTAKKVKACLDQIEEGFYSVLIRAQKNREISAQRDVRALSRYLTSSMQGLLVVGKIQRHRATLNDIVKTILHILD